MKHLSTTLLLFFVLHFTASAQLSLRWEGTSGNKSGTWNDRFAWRRVSGGTLGVDYQIVGANEIPLQAPRTSDNVLFPDAGISGGASTVITIDQNSVCRNLIWETLGAGKTPRLTSAASFSLTVYGSMVLENDINWDINGALVFGATATGTYNLTFAGRIMKNTVRFDGNATAEWVLQDSLRLNTASNLLGRLQLNQGILNTNGQKVAAFMFYSNNANTNRKLRLGSSVLWLYGTSNWSPAATQPVETTARPWHSDFNAAAQVEAGTSEIRFVNASGAPTWGSNVTINYVNYINVSGNSSVNAGPPSGTGRINKLEIRPNVGGGDATTITGGTIGELVLYENRGYVFSANITLTKLTVVATCGYAYLYSNVQTLNRTISTTTNPITVSNIALRNIVFTRTGTTAYNVTNYVDLSTQGGGSAWPTNSSGTNVSVTAAVPKTYYWVGGSGSWGDTNKWSLSSGGTPIGGSCLPTLADDVVFDANSGAAGFTARLNIPSSEAQYQCRNLTWTGASAGSGMRIDNQLNVYGNFTLQEAANINLGGTPRDIAFYSTSGTITSSGATFSRNITFTPKSDYTILDNLTITGQLQLLGATFRTSNRIINAASMYTSSNASAWIMNNTTVNLSSNSPYSQYAVPVFTQTGTNVVNMTAAGNITIFTNDLMTITLPSLVVQNPNSSLLLEDRGTGFNIKGNLTLNGNAFLNGQSATSVAISKVAIEGNMTLAIGKTYIFPAGARTGAGTGRDTTGSPLRIVNVKNVFTAKSICEGSAIFISGANGAQTNFGAGSVDVEYTVLSGLLGRLPATYTAQNSVDLGGNTNWTFPVTVSPKTYYWRRKKGTTIFSGNWSDRGFWANNVADVQGDSLCMPSAFDNVVFDNNSFSGADRTVTIDALATCANFTASYSGAAGNTLAGSQRLILTGSLQFHTSLTNNYTGDITFAATTTGQTINTAGRTLNSNITFDGAGGEWTLAANINVNAKRITINKGNFYSGDKNITTGTFASSGTSARSINLGKSAITVTQAGAGTLGNATNHAWDFATATNLSFTQNNGGKIILSAVNATFNGGNQTFEGMEFSNATSTTAILRNFVVDSMKIMGTSFIYGSNTYNVLELNPGKTYTLENGRTQTIAAPNGNVIATGSAGNFITIQSAVNGSKAFMYKANGTPLCFDYIRAQDITAQRQVGNTTVEFQTGANSDNVGNSSDGVWVFNKPTYVAPAANSGADQVICRGSFAPISFNFSGTGAYQIQVTGSDGTSYNATFPDGTATGTIWVNPNNTTTYTVSSIRSFNCATLVTGTIADATQVLTIRAPAALATNGMTGTCFFNNDDTFITFIDNATQRPIMAINDKSDVSDGSALGNTTVTVHSSASVQSFYTYQYLQRYFQVTPTNNGPAKVRLYFTQAELNAIGTAVGYAVTASSLNLTRVPSANVSVNGSGVATINDISGATFHTPIASGAIASGITTTNHVFYADFIVPGFSYLFLHPQSTILPISLLNFGAKFTPNQTVHLHWQTASERNSSFFAIERSADGKIFEEIDQVEAAGSSSQTLFYETFDKQPLAGVSYYRLRIVDNDGTYEYSSVVSVRSDNTKNDAETFELYPNPTHNGLIHVRYKGNSSNVQSIELHSALGKTLQKYEMGTNTFIPQINLANNAKGVYWVVIYLIDGSKQVQKLVYQ